MADVVRCKFRCVSITKIADWYKKDSFLYDYKFQVVTGDSEENKQFFASTPTGNLEFRAVRDDMFEPGKEYYLDLSAAQEA